MIFLFFYSFSFNETKENEVMKIFCNNYKPTLSTIKQIKLQKKILAQQARQEKQGFDRKHSRVS